MGGQQQVVCYRAHHMLQKVHVLYCQVVGVTNRTHFWHNQEMARSHRVAILEGDNHVILVHDIGRLLLSNDAREDVLLARLEA